MAKTTAIHTLIELSTKKTEDAVKRLGTVSAFAKSEEEKLKMLQNYISEYDEKFKLAMSRGLSPVMYQNYQQFMTKMQKALATQQQSVSLAHKRVNEATKSWQDNEREKMSFTTLLKRSEDSAKLKESKRDQKETDERASRSFYKKK